MFSKQTKPPSLAQPPLSVEDEVLEELIQLHATVLTRMPLVQGVLVIGLGLLILPYVNSVMFFSWSLLTLSLEWLRASYAKTILQRTFKVNPQKSHLKLIVLAALAGASVGMSALLFMTKIPAPNQALLGIILFTIPVAGVSVAVSSRPILAFYAFFIMASNASSWAMLYPQHTLPTIGLTMLYWGFIVCIAADGEHLLRRSVSIRRERDSMLTDLELRNEEVRAAVASAELSAQTRARALAAASHDLRQPLHALSVYSAVLVSNPTPEILPEIAHNIDRLVRALGTLLHGLLDLSRLSAEYYVPERQLLALDKLLEDICNEFASAIIDKQLRLIRRLDPVFLRDDPVAIARIARNLLDNALKYTVSGEIRVRTYASAGVAYLSIEDTGKGILLDEQQRIFEEFYQLDNPGRDYTKGVGLGLAIVQRLCESIKASITLTSTPGSGSIFCVSFLSQVNNSQTANTNNSKESAILREKRIYVVDDEIDILNSTKVLLCSWQIRVESALSSRATEALFTQFGKPDLLIVDLRLRDQENGAELAHRLQGLYGQFPVLVITGETTSESLFRCDREGYPLLQKPITPEVLFDAVCSAFKYPNH